jgi:Condensation domain
MAKTELSAPLAPWQLDLWLAERLLSPGTALTIATRFALPPETAPDTVRRAAAQVFRAHPVLATGVDERSGIPRLVHMGSPQVRVERVRDRAEIDERLRRDAATPVALDGPLARCTLFVSRADRAVVASLIVHHLVFDGISQRLVFRDFAAALQGTRLAARDDYFGYARAMVPDAPLSAAAALRAAQLERHLSRPAARVAGPPGPLRSKTLRLTGRAYAAWLENVRGSASRPSVHALAITIAALREAIGKPRVVGVTTDARPSDRLGTVGDFANVFPMFFGDEDLGEARDLRCAVARELDAARAMRAEPIMRDISAAARAASLSVPVVTFRRFGPRVLGKIRVEPFIENDDAKRPLAFQIIDFGDELACRIESGSAAFASSTFEQVVRAFRAALQRGG